MIKAVIILAGLLPGAALGAYSPADFRGIWTATAIVGSGHVTGPDDPKALLGTTVIWTDTTFTSVDENCDIRHGAMTIIPNRTLEWDWGGEKISELSLPAPVIRATFGKVETLVFGGGEGGCAQDAVMMDHDHMLFMFYNGYIYILTRRH